MTPFARYVHLLDSLISQRIPDDPEAKRAEAKRMRREGLPVTEVARRFGVSRQTVRTWCSESKPRFFHSRETKEKYLALRASGVSIRKAAAQFGLSKSTVTDWG